jgi:hypothetical protein
MVNLKKMIIGRKQKGSTMAKQTYCKSPSFLGPQGVLEKWKSGFNFGTN